MVDVWRSDASRDGPFAQAVLATCPRRFLTRLARRWVDCAGCTLGSAILPLFWSIQHVGWPCVQNGPFRLDLRACFGPFSTIVSRTCRKDRKITDVGPLSRKLSSFSAYPPSWRPSRRLVGGSEGAWRCGFNCWQSKTHGTCWVQSVLFIHPASDRSNSRKIVNEIIGK